MKFITHICGVTGCGKKGDNMIYISLINQPREIQGPFATEEAARAAAEVMAIHNASKKVYVFKAIVSAQTGAPVVDWTSEE